MPTLGNLPDHPRRPAGHDAETRDDGIGGDDGTVQDAHVVLDDGELADDNARPDVHVAADGSGLDDGPLAHEDLVPEPQRQVRERALVDAAGRPQAAPLAQETVPPDRDSRVAAADGRGCCCCCWRGARSARSGRRGRLHGSVEVASDHGFGLDHGLPA